MSKIFILLITLLFNTNLNAQIALEWALDIDNSITNSNSSINDIEVDPAGNVYVIGYFSGTVDFDPGPGTDIRTADWNDVFLQKYNNAGIVQWTKTFGGTSNDIGYHIELDASNNIYAVGQFGTTVDFDPGFGTNSITTSGSLDVFLQKFSTNGTFQWVKTFGGTQNELPYSFARDQSGNLIITGYFNGTTDFDPGASTANRTAIAPSDAYVLKLDFNGNFDWVATMGGPGTSSGNAISVDGSGNIYSFGRFTQTIDLDPGVGISNFTTSTTDLYIQKLNASGVFQWAKTINGTSSALRAYGLKVQSGFIYLNGSFTNTADFDPGLGISNHTSNGNYDNIIIKLDDNGNYVWSFSSGGIDVDRPEDIYVNASDEVLITGFFADTVDFDPGPNVNNLISNGCNDIFIQKLDASGNYIWATSMGGLNCEWGYAIKADANGNIYLGGNFSSPSIDFDPGPNVSNFSGSAIYESYILKLNECTATAATDIQTACISYTWIDGNTYTSSNSSATYTLANAAGCDSLVTLALTIVNSATGIDTRTECNAYTWIDGNNYTASNNSASFNLVGGASNGCDSLVTLALTIVNSATGTDTRTECNAYTWIDGNNYTSSNNSASFNLVGGASNGCDSLVTLALTIINTATGTDTRTECNAYTWIDGNNYTSSNNSASFNLVGGASNGCDSLVTLDLTINSVSDLTTSISGLSIIANNSVATYQWLDCDNNYDLINGETGQTFIASANGNFAVELTENGCVDTSSCVAITTVGIVENSFEGILKVYPNPTCGYFSIDLGASYESSWVSITDILGKLIVSKNLSQTQFLNFSIKEPAGIYIVSIEAGDKKAIIRLVKE